MKLNDLPRTLRTVRHLKLSQVAYRAQRVAKQRLRWRETPNRPVESIRPEDVDIAQIPVVGPLEACEQTPREVLRGLASGRFTHLNETKSLRNGDIDWCLGPRSQDRLWCVTLHYHRWAYDLAAIIASDEHSAGQAATAEAEQTFVDLLSDWLDACHIRNRGAEPLAWNSYAIATRLGWWSRSLAMLGQSWWNDRPEFSQRFLSSFYEQAQFLSDHIEWDLRANHLMRDFVGLAWAGRVLRGAAPNANTWTQTAISGALAQANEQILDDGGHFERSPHYHLQMMDDLLTVRTFTTDPAARQQLDSAWQSMAEFATWMRHPDEGLAQFNDTAAFGHGSAERMLTLGREAGLATCDERPTGWHYFADTGYVAWHDARWSAFVDVGPVGPDYQPGHAHADTLSIEASFDGQRLFVDPGTHSYDLDDRRKYDRSTSAHNTVCIDGYDSSEVWHIFRVGRRARPRDVIVDGTAESLHLTASHNGYDHLPGRPKHTRDVLVEENGPLRIEDTISSTHAHRVDGGFLLAPEWSVEATANGWHLRCGHRNVRVVVECDKTLELSDEVRVWHPEYGVEVATTRLCWRYSGKMPLQVRIHVSAAS